MKYDCDQIVDRKCTNSLKWDKYDNTDIIPMWVADMDFKCPPAVIEKTFSENNIPTACISEDAAQNTLTFMAPSKTFNMPGLGCSFAVIKNQDLMEKLKPSGKGIVPDVNTLGLAAATAAYEKCDDWLAELILYLRSNRDYLEKEINQLSGLKLNHIEATYLAWIDVRNADIENPARFFEDAGVGLSCGSFFGQKGFVRLNFGCPKSILEKAVGRIKTALL